MSKYLTITDINKNEVFSFRKENVFGVKKIKVFNKASGSLVEGAEVIASVPGLNISTQTAESYEQIMKQLED